MRHLGSIMAAAAAMLIAAGLPAAAQTSSPNHPALPGGHANVSDATVGKVGAALRDVVQIKQSYAQRLQSAKTPTEQQDLSKQASGEATASIARHGLSIDQYNQVIREAQNDPALKERVLAAAKLHQ
jgi:hypothetical protein